MKSSMNVIPRYYVKGLIRLIGKPITQDMIMHIQQRRAYCFQFSWNEMCDIARNNPDMLCLINESNEEKIDYIRPDIH